MPETGAALSMPVPLGISETGAFADPIAPEAIEQLKARGPGGSVSAEILTGKGSSGDAHFGMVGGEMIASDLGMAGWAVMFGAKVSKKIRTSLAPLIEHRRKQVDNPALFKDNLDPPASRQTAAEWLVAHGTSLNVVDPARGVPYYVLIVASPEDVPFEFQYELDLYWGVGRLWLEHEADYERYAQSVVAYETRAKMAESSRTIAIFAPDYQGKDNGAGKLLTDNLIKPMIESGLGKAQKFQMQALTGAAATKESLGGLFHSAPALLFTGSHGLLKRPESKELAAAQGAIVCEPWADPPHEDSYYAAWDLPRKASIHGMVYFSFACYSVGWPHRDTYGGGKKAAISPAPMMARLPQTLLGRENGALAVLGHVDRAWSSSYSVDGQPQDQTFRDVLMKIMAGYRLGSATDQFNMRWAALSIPLAATLQRMRTRRGLEKEAAQLWVRFNDARNYILHGDPAVKLAV